MTGDGTGLPASTSLLSFPDVEAPQRAGSRTRYGCNVRVLKVRRLAQRDLKRVRAAARNYEAARIALRDAMHAANLSGESVRDIAHYANRSPSRVQELLQEARRLEKLGE